MASTDYMSDVSLQQNIQEIEIEAIPVEIPCETVETTINYEGEPMHIAIPRFTDTKPKKWEQKRVQIRTLEGEFSVTMWATGTDDGECSITG